jgi:hypothetical protein
MKIKILKEMFYLAGLTSIILIVLRQIKNLKKNELLHVNIENIFYSNTKNMWDKYFYQPFVGKYKFIKNNNYSFVRWNSGKDLNFGYGEKKMNSSLFNKKNILFLRGLFKKHIIFKEEIIKKANKFIDRNISKQNVISVHIRGTDHFTTGHAAGQKHLMDYDTYIKPVILKKLTKTKCKKIFLATDENEIYLKFKKDFGKILIKNPTTLAKKNSIQSIFQKNVYETEDRKSAMATEVISDIIIMSKCKFSLCMRSGVSLLNILMRQDYNYEFIDNHIDYNRMK